MSDKLVLGIDTSNYKTSLAVVDDECNILINESNLLPVEKGQKGLRQSDAFFKHSNDLPKIIEDVLSDEKTRENITAVSVSNRPRPVEDSYMPVFRAGENAATVLASALNVPLYKFSHQEGHIKAVTKDLNLKDKFIAYHLSGGTTEALLINNDEIKIIGGTLDISFGQLIDRVGVKLGMNFPAGKEMDELAVNSDVKLKPTEVRLSGGYFNLSGLETQCMKAVENGLGNEIVTGMFETIGETLVKETKYLSDKYLINEFVFTGGVSSSEYLRNYINKNAEAKVYFGEPKLSADNAVGIAILGGMKDV